MSAVAAGGEGAPASLRQAQDAGVIARALTPGGGALAYEGLGAYRYLVHLALDDAPHDRLPRGGGAAARLRQAPRDAAARDARAVPRGPRRVATTARALFIHANTLRQRLDRIQR